MRGRVARTLLTVGGVAATMLLVLVLSAAHRRLASSVDAYVGQRDIDLWIAPPGTDNLIRSTGVLRLEVVPTVQALTGVEAAFPLLRSFVRVSPTDPPANGSADERLTLLAIGYAAPDGLGGPPLLASGTAPRSGDEIVLDRASAFRLGVGVGDTVRVNGRRAGVAGLSRGTNLLATQFLFSNLDGARRAGGIQEGVSFVAVKVSRAGTAAEVARRIRDAVPEVEVFERARFVANNLREVASGLLPLLALITALGVGVAAVLVVLLVQGLVEDRRQELAVLLSLGAGVWHIGTGLITRAALLVLSGGVIGGLLAYALGRFLEHFAPQVELTYAWSDFLLVFVLFLFAGIMAATIPLLRLRRIDPLEAFRA